MKILVLTPFFYPAYKAGGPARSLYNLFSNERFSNDNVDIVTGSCDLGETKYFDDIEVNQWSKVGACSVFYSKLLLSSRIWFLLKLLKGKQYDVIYLNGFFNLGYSILPLILLKFLRTGPRVYIAPRGELSDGALSIKTMKKKILMLFYSLFKVSSSIIFHFTSVDEKIESLSNFSNINFFTVAPNMHECVPTYSAKEKNKNELKILFLSRVSPKKQLHILLEALTKVNSNGKFISLKIVGQIDDQDYWRKCEQIINNEMMALNVEVIYLGAINRTRVKEEFLDSHLFCLPTLNENYGHAIVEGMVNSNLILISSNTPWTRVSDYGGFVSSKNTGVEFYVDQIEMSLKMDQCEFNSRTKGIHTYICDVLYKNELNALNLFNEEIFHV
jgi:glycosyltransferase involved in cell wall biosynthesis